MSEPEYKFERGNVVQIKSLPGPKMLVIGNNPYDDRGYGTPCACLFWFDENGIPHQTILPESALELSGL